MMLVSCAVSAKAPSRFEMETLLCWHEARGQSLQVQQLVLDTARNRAKMSHKSLYEVLTVPHQYSWAAHLKTWKLTQEQAKFGFRLLENSKVVRSKYVYFNDSPLSFTQKNVKVGGLYFAVR